MKNYLKAEEFYNNAKNIYEKYFSRAHPEYVKILSKLAKVYYMEKDYKRSKKNIEEALNDYDLFIKQYFSGVERTRESKYWNTMKGDFEFYNTLAFGQLEDFSRLGRQSVQLSIAHQSIASEFVHKNSRTYSEQCR